MAVVVEMRASEDRVQEGIGSPCKGRHLSGAMTRQGFGA